MTTALQPDTWEIRRDVVPRPMIEAVLRRMYLYVRYEGLPPVDRLEWPHDPFLELRGEPEVRAIAQYVQDTLQPPGELIQPHQLVWHLPDEETVQGALAWHTDQPPHGYRYTLIVGVAFDHWTPNNGTVRVWKPGPVAVVLNPGDAVLLAPDIRHSPGYNFDCQPRKGAYFRWGQRL
jgi:hypothetical protein